MSSVVVGTRRATMAAAVGRAKVLGVEVTPEDRERADRHMNEVLGQLKGMSHKMGQILSMSGDASGPYANLSIEGPRALSWPDIERMLVAELGDWQRPFARLQTTPLAVASLSQVHAGATECGRSVVVKVQFPRIENVIREDLRTLGWLGVPFKNLQKRFRFDEYRELFARLLREEADYVHEASNLALFREGHGDKSWLRLPEVVPEASARRVLTLTRLDGQTVWEAASTWSAPEKQVLAEGLLELVLGGFDGQRPLHIDPHPGNYRFDRTGGQPTVVLYDFGCLFRLDAKLGQTLANMILAVIEGRTLPWFDLLVEAGFDAAQLGCLNVDETALMRTIFAPFTSAAFDFGTWNLGDRLETLLGADRRVLRTAAPVGLFPLMRALQGVLFYQRSLGVTADWRAVALRTLKASR